MGLLKSGKFFVNPQWIVPEGCALMRGVYRLYQSHRSQDLGSTLLVSADVSVMQRRERWIPIPNFFIVTESIFRTMRRHLYFPPLLFSLPPVSQRHFHQISNQSERFAKPRAPGSIPRYLRGRNAPFTNRKVLRNRSRSGFAATGLFRTFAQL